MKLSQNPTRECPFHREKVNFCMVDNDAVKGLIMCLNLL